MSSSELLQWKYEARSFSLIIHRTNGVILCSLFCHLKPLRSISSVSSLSLSLSTSPWVTLPVHELLHAPVLQPCSLSLHIWTYFISCLCLWSVKFMFHPWWASYCFAVAFLSLSSRPSQILFIFWNVFPNFFPFEPWSFLPLPFYWIIPFILLKLFVISRGTSRILPLLPLCVPSSDLVFLLRFHYIAIISYLLLCILRQSISRIKWSFNLSLPSSLYYSHTPPCLAELLLT